MVRTGVVEVTEPAVVERFARRDLALHIYEIGDLDPFFWPRTRWWGWADDDGLRALALSYDGGDLPTLIVLGRDDGGAAGDLVAAIESRLPDRTYAHLSPGLVDRLSDAFVREPYGPHLKMVLGELNDLRPDGVVQLGMDDLAEIRALYERAYPGNWFDARMLQTEQYFGIREHGTLVCVAGVHVFSPEYAVAALGNVTTDPARRGRRLARRTTAELCRSLQRAGITTIGLNVHADNRAAIRCYESLGFVTAADYDEFLLARR